MNSHPLHIGILIAAIGTLVVIAFFLLSPQKEVSNHESSVVTDPVRFENVAPLTKEYTNSDYRFSLLMPADFSSRSLDPDESGRATILLQDAKGNGIQILVSKYTSATKAIVADDVRTSIPDMKITDEQVVEVGDDYRGVAFWSDNEAFDSASREVWFAFKGNLYQISTYARLDPLLQAMFATWKFF